jgi:hypothetical protein
MLMSGGWSSISDFPGVPNVNHCTLGKLPDHVTAWMTRGSPNDTLPPRMLVVNLSSRLRQFHTALAKTFTEELIAELIAERRRSQKSQKDRDRGKANHKRGRRGRT